MVQSRIKYSWRMMCGTTTNQEDWDPNSMVPPPNPVKSTRVSPKHTHMIQHTT